MLASAVFFTAMITFIKILGTEFPAPLQVFYRQAAALVFLSPWIVRQGIRVFATTRPLMLVFRSSGGTLGLMLANYAYQQLPLAVANALSFTRALWIAPLALLLLGERLDAARLGATIVGFGGILMILGWDLQQPSALWPSLAGLGSAFLFAFTITGGKVMTRDHSLMTLMAWATVLGTMFALPPSLYIWRWPTATQFILLVLMGLAATLNQACFFKGLQRGDASAIAPVDYVRLVLAIIVGFFLFSEVPSWTSLAGAAIVVGSALFLAWREHSIGVRAAEAAEAEATSL